MSRRRKRAVVRVQSPALDLITEDEACRILGGTKPISKHSLYRGIAACRYPRGVLVSPNCRRYLRSEVESALRDLIEARRA